MGKILQRKRIANGESRKRNPLPAPYGGARGTLLILDSRCAILDSVLCRRRRRALRLPVKLQSDPADETERNGEAEAHDHERQRPRERGQAHGEPALDARPRPGLRVDELLGIREGHLQAPYREIALRRLRISAGIEDPQM